MKTAHRRVQPQQPRTLPPPDFSKALEDTRNKPGLFSNQQHQTYQQIVDQLTVAGYSISAANRAPPSDKPGWSAWIVHVAHPVNAQFDLLFFLPKMFPQL